MPTKDSLSKRRTHKIIERLQKEKTKNHTRRKKKKKNYKKKTTISYSRNQFV